jgi:hypothetical protein
MRFALPEGNFWFVDPQVKSVWEELIDRKLFLFGGGGFN